jgi:hypothetical protein
MGVVFRMQSPVEVGTNPDPRFPFFQTAELGVRHGCASLDFSILDNVPLCKR